MIKHAHTATGTNDPAKQISVDRWNEGHVIDEDLILPVFTPAAPPATDKLSLYAKKVGGRVLLSQMGPTGRDTTYQPSLGGNKTALWMPPGNAATVPGVFGMAAFTAIGTATLRNVATTNLLTRMTRLGYVSAATAGSLAGPRVAAAQYTTGAGGGLGGFFLRCRFGVSDAAAVSGARMFVGMQASTGAPTDVDPATGIANHIGVAQIAGSANLHIVSSQGASPLTPVDLGANFPAANTAVAYELALFLPSSGGCFWEVNRLNHTAVASGEIDAGSIPLGTTLLCFNSWRCNVATALAVGLDICGLSIESDY